MIHVKVKTKGIYFVIPIPYVIINITISILLSKFVQHIANKWTKKYFERKKLHFTFPQIDKKLLQPIVKELKNCKGIMLVNITAKDGTKVEVRL